MAGGHGWKAPVEAAWPSQGGGITTVLVRVGEHSGDGRGKGEEGDRCGCGRVTQELHGHGGGASARPYRAVGRGKGSQARVWEDGRREEAGT